MRTGTVATAVVVATAFPVPHTPIILTHHRGRFEDSEIGSNSFDHFRRQCACIKSILKKHRFLVEFFIMRIPVTGYLIDRIELAAIPRFIIQWRLVDGWLGKTYISRGSTTTGTCYTSLGRYIAANPQIRKRHKPGHLHPHCFLLARVELQRYKQRSPRSAGFNGLG